MRQKLLEKLSFPLIQGGMGVGISLSNLAGNVMKQGCIGVISAAHPGYRKPNFRTDSIACNVEAIQEEVDKARLISEGKGLLGINIMSASRDYITYVKASVKAKVDIIISGAGLPLDLPKYTQDTKILLAPIVSSAKAAYLICRTWMKRYQVLPDFMIVEGSEAGGHLGFTKESLLDKTTQSLSTILKEVKETLQAFEIEHQAKIPVFVAGGVYDGEDIAKYISEGAYGVQMGTRFIATQECDADDKFKQAIVDCSQEDIKIIHSPSGLPGRGLNTRFMKNNPEDKRVCMKNCYMCLKSCTPENTPYCISQALINAAKGMVDFGVVFVGSNGYRVNEIIPVKTLIDSLKQETKEVLTYEPSLSI